MGVDELVLAAPDIDVDVFRSLAKNLKSAANGITLYSSSTDRALKLSEFMAGGPRAGSILSTGPLLMSGIETIDVTAAGNDIFGINHSIFSRAGMVLGDIGRILISVKKHPPDARSVEIRAVPEGSKIPLYWKIPE